MEEFNGNLTEDEVLKIKIFSRSPISNQDEFDDLISIIRDHLQDDPSSFEIGTLKKFTKCCYACDRYSERYQPKLNPIFTVDERLRIIEHLSYGVEHSEDKPKLQNHFRAHRATQYIELVRTSSRYSVINALSENEVEHYLNQARKDLVKVITNTGDNESTRYLYERYKDLYFVLSDTVKQKYGSTVFFSKVDKYKNNLQVFSLEDDSEVRLFFEIAEEILMVVPTLLQKGDDPALDIGKLTSDIARISSAIAVLSYRINEAFSKYFSETGALKMKSALWFAKSLKYNYIATSLQESFSDANVSIRHPYSLYFTEDLLVTYLSNNTLPDGGLPDIEVFERGLLNQVDAGLQFAYKTVTDIKRAYSDILPLRNGEVIVYVEAHIEKCMNEVRRRMRLSPKKMFIDTSKKEKNKKKRR